MILCVYETARSLRCCFICFVSYVLYIYRYIVFFKLINTFFICANGHEGEGNTGDKEVLGWCLGEICKREHGS